MANTKVPARKSEILVGVGETPTKLAAARDFTMNINRTSIDVSTLGTEWMERLVGQIDANGSFNLIYDTADTIAGAAIESAAFDGTEITLYFRPEGSSAGAKQYTLPCFVSGWSVSASTNDAVTIAVSWESSGEGSSGTVGS